MKRSAGAAVVSLSIAGCAQLLPPPVIAKNPDHCRVSNASCFLDVYNASGWHVDPDKIHVSDGARDVNLFWRLPDGYAFCENDAVEFKKETQGQFSGGQGVGTAGHGKKQYHWKDANTVSDTFPYKVTFHKDDCSGDPIVVDPGVVNEM